jgi:hypothetical protein
VTMIMPPPKDLQSDLSFYQAVCELVNTAN